MARQLRFQSVIFLVTTFTLILSMDCAAIERQSYVAWQMIEENEKEVDVMMASLKIDAIFDGSKPGRRSMNAEKPQSPIAATNHQLDRARRQIRSAGTGPRFKTDDSGLRGNKAIDDHDSSGDTLASESHKEGRLDEGQEKSLAQSDLVSDLTHEGLHLVEPSPKQGSGQEELIEKKETIIDNGTSSSGNGINGTDSEMSTDDTENVSNVLTFRRAADKELKSSGGSSSNEILTDISGNDQTGNDNMSAEDDPSGTGRMRLVQEVTSVLDAETSESTKARFNVDMHPFITDSPLTDKDNGMTTLRNILYMNTDNQTDATIETKISDSENSTDFDNKIGEKSKSDDNDGEDLEDEIQHQNSSTPISTDDTENASFPHTDNRLEPTTLESPADDGELTTAFRKKTRARSSQNVLDAVTVSASPNSDHPGRISAEEIPMMRISQGSTKRLNTRVLTPKTLFNTDDAPGELDTKTELVRESESESTNIRTSEDNRSAVGEENGTSPSNEEAGQRNSHTTSNRFPSRAGISLTTKANIYKRSNYQTTASDVASTSSQTGFTSKFWSTTIFPNVTRDPSITRSSNKTFLKITHQDRTKRMSGNTDSQVSNGDMTSTTYRVTVPSNPSSLPTTQEKTTIPPKKSFMEKCSRNDCKKPLVCKPSSGTCVCEERHWFSASLQDCKKVTYWGLTFDARHESDLSSEILVVNWTLANTDDVKKVHIDLTTTVPDGGKTSSSVNLTVGYNKHIFRKQQFGSKIQVKMKLELERGALLPSGETTVDIVTMAKIINVTLADYIMNKNGKKNRRIKYTIDVTRGCFDSIEVTFYNQQNKRNNVTYEIPVDQRQCHEKPMTIRKEDIILPTNLFKGSTYDVHFVLKMGGGQRDDFISYTLMTCPGRPSGLTVSRRGLDYLMLSWMPPNKGNVEKYQIMAERNHGSHQFETKGNQTELRIERLNQNWTYTLKVKARYGSCWGPEKKLSDVRTLQGVPGPVSSLHYNEWASTPKLNWNKDPNSQQVDVYNISANCSLSGFFSFQTEQEELVVDFINNGDCCTFEVWGVNELGNGNKSSVKKLPRLESQHEPTVSSIDPCDGGIMITMAFPDGATPTQGSIFEYRVELTSSSNIGGTKIMRCKGQGCIYPCEYQVPDDVQYFSADESEIFVEFPLTPETNYTVQIQPKSVNGPLAYISTSITTPESAPKNPLQNVNVTNVWMDAAEVTWTRPSCPSQTKIVNFTIMLVYNEELCHEPSYSNGSIPTKHTEKPIAHNLSKLRLTSFNLTQLRSNTNYVMKVGVDNGMGQGQIWSNVTTFKTLRNLVTGPVRNIQFQPETRAIHVTWSPPCPSNGPIDTYHVYVFNDSRGLVDKMDTSNTSCTIRDLMPATDYLVQINSTLEVNMVSNDRHTRTKDGRPGPVENLKLRQQIDLRKPRLIFCKWDPPKVTNGTMVKYTVTFQSKKGRFSKRTSDTETYLEALPETFYTVVVAATTTGGKGQPVRDTIFVKAGIVPDPIEKVSSPLVHQLLCSKIDATKSVTLNLPIEFLCDKSYGQIQKRGVVVARVTDAKDDFDPKIVMDESKEVTIQLAESSTHTVMIPDEKFQCDSSSQTMPEGCLQQTAGAYSYVIGQTACSHTGCNRYLTPGTNYRFKAFICTSAGCTNTMRSLTITTEETSDDSLIIGLVIGIMVVLIALIVFVVYRKKDKIVARIRGQKLDNQNLQMEPRSIPKRPIPLTEFLERVELMHKDSNLIFSEEYQQVVNLSPTLSKEVANNPLCRKKNRYTNVLPFDHARVKLLPSDDDEASDYINASFIPGFSGPREYIAAQGPLPATVDDFWRMIWEHKVSAIVMLTQCTEKGQVKCEQYWPSESTANFYGDLKVILRSESVLADYVIRVMDLELDGQKRTIHQFHFLKFPDFGCPDKTELLLNLVNAVRDHTPHDPNNLTVVHCSAGVGRTGTYISLDVLLNQIRDPHCQEVDIFNFVLTMRQNRPLMVQRENQYIYIFDCLRDSILNESREEHSEVNQEDALYSNCSSTDPQSSSTQQPDP